MTIQTSNENYYKFKLGKFECVSVSDGTYDYNPAQIFSGINDDEVNKLLSDFNMPADKITSPYTFLFVNTGQHKVLVDMGAGKLGPNTGKLIKNLKLAGIHHEEIDTVFITHAHPDHIGGALDEEGNPNYPNARYIMWKKEWDFWFSDEAIKATEADLPQAIPMDMFMKFARGNLEPLKDRIEFITKESEVMPGINLYFTPGHTPGHMVVSFTSENEELFFTSDTVIFPLFLERPDVRLTLDILTDVADASKHRIFDLVAEKTALVLAQHFSPFPSLGHIVKKRIGWKWQPILLD